MENLTIEECRSNIQDFANKHKIVFEDKGEVGFGRECVGLISGNNYIGYNPRHSETFEIIEGFESREFDKIAPSDAYHKGDYIAVLGRGDDAIRQLSDWVSELNKLDVVVEQYPTGATGLQAMMTGVFGKAIKLKS